MFVKHFKHIRSKPSSQSVVFWALAIGDGHLKPPVPQRAGQNLATDC